MLSAVFHGAVYALLLEISLKVTIEEPDGDISKLTGPKHGILDPTGAPHFGGGTFAGGSGTLMRHDFGVKKSASRKTTEWNRFTVDRL